MTGMRQHIISRLTAADQGGVFFFLVFLFFTKSRAPWGDSEFTDQCSNCGKSPTKRFCFMLCISSGYNGIVNFALSL